MSQPNIRLPPKWIELNITKRECATFLASPTEELVCQCGRRKIDHGDFVKHQHRPETWSPTVHTKPFNTDAYGTILFEGEHHPNKAHYVRLSYDTSPELIVQMMTYVWNLEMPQLLISVRGGSTKFEMSPRLGKIFQAGIIKAARSTNAWVFSNGLNSGAARHLGMALAHEKFLVGPRRGRVVSVGIGPWGMIENRNDLLGRNKDRTYSPLDHAKSKFLQLNSRHSNFLLVDNGSVGKFGGENYLRRRLEKCIASYRSSPNRGCDTPVIVIVIEGGFYTLRQVSDYLNDEQPIPVVVFAGTGRCADLIAWTLKRIRTDDDFVEMKDKINQKIMQLFRINSENQCSLLYQELRNIYAMKSLITVYNPNSTASEEFDSVILSSIFRSQHWSPLEQLSLTLVWNRVDIAQTEVFIYGRDWSRDHLEHAMMEALVSNRLDFVTLLLEQGLNMQTFLTASRLEALYSLERMPSKLLRSLLVELSKIHVMRQKQVETTTMSRTGKPERNLTLHDIGIALSHMIGHVYKSNYIHIVAKIHKSQGGVAEDHEVRAQTFLQPFDDLFIWAVLTKRHEMSKLLWRHGRGALAKALVAVKLNKYMATEIHAQEKTFTNLAIDFENYADEWETLSLSLLDTSYQSNSKMATLLLTMELEGWSKQTCLTLAVMANHRSLLGHPCCQQLLADLWMGALRIKSYSTFKVVLGVLFPFFAFLWEYKSTEELKLLPHQGKSGHSLNVLVADTQPQETITSTRGKKHPDPLSAHHRTHMAHPKHGGVVRSTSSLMTLLLHRDSKSNYIQDYYQHQVEQGLERKTDLAEVVRNIFPGNQPEAENDGVGIRSPTNEHPDNHHPHHHHQYHHVESIHNQNQSLRSKFHEESDIESYPLSYTTEEISSLGAPPYTTGKIIGHSFITTHHSLDFCSKFVEFQSAPVTNFYRHTIAYLVFLVSLAYVILYPQDHSFPGWTECYVIAYFCTQFLECIREFIVIDALSFSEKLAEIQQNVWQLGDLLMVSCCLFGGVVLRLTPGYFEYGMLVYRLSSMYWHARLFKYMGVHRFLGPKIVMMRRMLKHMVHFAMIIVVVIISFGIAREAIRFPHNGPSTKDLAESFLDPYMMMFGEVDMDTVGLKCGDDDNDGHPECPPGQWIIPVTWVVYMLVANILIVNVLIAVFNGIYEEVDSIAVEVWMFQRFNFVMEFEQKPVLPPPFIIICHAISFLKFIYEKFFSCLCEEELLWEGQLDDDIRPHIIMGNDHSLKSFLSHGEQSMVFDFEEENVENLTAVFDKEGNGKSGKGVGGGGVVQLTNNNIATVADAAAAAFRLGMGNEKFTMQQIKLVIGELHTELEAQKMKVDQLLNGLERERELQGDEDDDLNDDEQRAETGMNLTECVTTGTCIHDMSCCTNAGGIPNSSPSDMDENDQFGTGSNRKRE